jgi:hypothetical protein
MKKIFIKLSEIEKLDPRMDPSFKPRDCYETYAKRLEIVNQLLEQRHPGFFINDITTFTPHPIGYRLFERHVNPSGFTPEEYKEITGWDLTERPYTDIDFKIDIVDRKVCKFKQSGNISMNRGAAPWTAPHILTSTAREVGYLNFI